MFTRSIPALLCLFLVCLTLGLCPSRVCGQTRTPAPTVADLQLEIRRLRTRSDDLRREVKRQQRAIGTARRELQSLQNQVGNLEAESGKLRTRMESLAKWLIVLGVVSATGLAIGLLRRGGAEGAPAPLALARERTGRIHEGLAALEARIQIIEQQSPRG